MCCKRRVSKSFWESSQHASRPHIGSPQWVHGIQHVCILSRPLNIELQLLHLARNLCWRRARFLKVLTGQAKKSQIRRAVKNECSSWSKPLIRRASRASSKDNSTYPLPSMRDSRSLGKLLGPGTSSSWIWKKSTSRWNFSTTFSKSAKFSLQHGWTTLQAWDFSMGRQDVLLRRQTWSFAQRQTWAVSCPCGPSIPSWDWKIWCP